MPSFLKARNINISYVSKYTNNGLIWPLQYRENILSDQNIFVKNDFPESNTFLG